MSLFLYCRYFCPQRQFFFPVNKCEGYWRAQKPVLSTRLVISLSLVAGPKSSDNRKIFLHPFLSSFLSPFLLFCTYIFFQQVHGGQEEIYSTSKPASQPAGPWNNFPARLSQCAPYGLFLDCNILLAIQPQKSRLQYFSLTHTSLSIVQIVC